MNKNSKIYIAGHRGMVGSAIARKLKREGFANIIVRQSSELDLRDPHAVGSFFRQEQPEYVVLAAARVGGIQANINNPGVFLYDNLMIQNNVIHAAYGAGVKKLLFLGSSCIYPKQSPQPMKEEYLLTGKLEPTNEGYALAKIAGIKLLESYRKQYGFIGISLMPCNLYGPNDSFDLQHSHVLSALVRRFSDAVDDGVAEIELWGTGEARREFMHVDDLADAAYFFMETYDGIDFINVGWGEDISIRELAELIAARTGYTGKIKWDASKPNGMMRKCMDVTRMKAYGYTPRITLEQGVEQMIGLYRNLKMQQPNSLINH